MNRLSCINRARTFFGVVMILFFATAPVHTQDTAAADGDAPPEILEPSAIVSRVLSSDPTVLNSRRSVESARASYALTRAGTLPNVTIDVTPFSWDQRRISTGATSQRVRTSTVGAGVSVEQPLPTSGSLSASLSNDTSLIENGGSKIEQSPEMSISLFQPLFVNGSLVSTDVFRAGLRNAAISVERSETSDRVTVNGNIRSALGLYVQVSSLRRTIAVFEQTIDVLGRQLEAAEIDREQGLISDNAVLALQVTLNDRREALFDTRLALVDAEQRLARVLGLETLDGVSVAAGFPSIPVPMVEDLETALRSNPSVTLSRLAVEQTVQGGLLNELQDRPSINVTARVAPVYPDSRDDPDDFAASFSDLFGSEADLEATVALGLRIPVLTARERRLREESDTLARMQAETQLADTERSVVNTLQSLRIRRQFLEERVELLETDVEFQRQRVANEETLLEAGATTELRRDEILLDLRSRENELWQVQAELFLNTLDIHATLGTPLPELFDD